MNIDTILKILGSIGGLFVAVQQIIKIYERPNERKIILEDLDIYLKTPDSFSEKEIIEAKIKANIKSLYSDKALKETKKIDWGQVVILIFMAIGLAYWSYYLSREGFSFWSILPGFFALGGLQAIYDEVTLNANKSKI